MFPQRSRPSYLGESRDVQKKALLEKYSADIAQWMELYLGLDPLGGDLIEVLKDGVLLCNLLRKFRPSIESELGPKYRFPPPGMKAANVFQSMEYVNCFIVGCHKIGMKSVDVFQAEDLTDKANPLKVVRTLQCFRLLVPSSQNEKYFSGEAQRRSMKLYGVSRGEFGSPTTPTTPAKEPPRVSDKSQEEEQTEPPTTLPHPAVTAPSSSAAAAAAAAAPTAATITVTADEARKPRLPASGVVGGGGEINRLQAPRFPSVLKHTSGVPLNRRSALLESSSFMEPMSPAIMAHLLSPRASRIIEIRDEADEEDEEEEEDLSQSAVEGSTIEDAFENEESDNDEEEETKEGADVSSSKTVIALRGELHQVQEMLQTEIVAHVQEAHELRSVNNEMRERLLASDIKLIAIENRAKQAEEQVLFLTQQMISMEKAMQNLTKALQLMSTTSYQESQSEKEEGKSSVHDPIAAKDDAKNQGGAADLQQKRMSTKSAVPLPALTISIPEMPHGLPNIEDTPMSTVTTGFLLPSASELSRRGKRSNSRWEHSVSVSFITGVSDEERQRQEAIHQFIESQWNYLETLKTFEKLFYLPIRGLVDSVLVSEHSIQRVFGSFDDLKSAVSMFVDQLSRRQKKELPLISGVTDIVENNIIYSFSTFHVAHLSYAGRYRHARRELKKLLKRSDPLVQYLEICKTSTEANNNSLEEWLAKPFKQIEETVELFEIVTEYTSADTIGRANSESVLKSLKEFNAEIQAVIADDSDVQRAFELDQLLDWGEIPEEERIVFSTFINEEDDGPCGVLYEGRLTRLRLRMTQANENLYCILLTGFLIFASDIHGESEYQYKVEISPVPINSIEVRDVTDDSTGRGANNVFIVTSLLCGTVVLYAASPAEKAKWLQAFRDEDLLVEFPLSFEDDANAMDILNKRRSVALLGSDEQALLQIELQNQPDFEERSSPDIPPLETLAATAKKPSQSNTLRRLLNRSRSKKSADLSRPNVTVGQLSLPEFAGYLKLLIHAPLKRFKDRYCVLKDFCLYIFNGMNKSEQAIDMVVLPNYSIKTAKPPNKHFMFKITHGSTLVDRFVFMAASQEDLDSWLEVLTQAALAKMAQGHHPYHETSV